MSVKRINLVKYAGDYWVTLADYTQTRSIEGYSNIASVKSAIRTFVVRRNPEKYIAFRGELQISNIVQENKNNPMFYPDDFKGHTRTALIHFSEVKDLNDRFAVSDEYKEEFAKFMKSAEDMVNKKDEEFPTLDSDQGSSIVEERSLMLRHLRNELSRLDRELEIKKKNRERILQAINAVESLEIEESL